MSGSIRCSVLAAVALAATAVLMPSKAEASCQILIPNGPVLEPGTSSEVDIFVFIQGAACPIGDPCSITVDLQAQIGGALDICFDTTGGVCNNTTQVVLSTETGSDLVSARALVTAPPSQTPGLAAITVTSPISGCQSGNGSALVIEPVVTPPATVTVFQDIQATIPLDVTVSPFVDEVELDFVVDSLLTGTLSQDQFTSSGTTNLTISNPTTTGSFPAEVVAFVSFDGSIHTFSYEFTIEVVPPFTLSVADTTPTLQVNELLLIPITLTRAPGFNDPINLSLKKVLEPIPEGVSIGEFHGEPFLVIQAGSRPDSFAFILQASSGSVQKGVLISVEILP